MLESNLNRKGASLRIGEWGMLYKALWVLSYEITIPGLSWYAAFGYAKHLYFGPACAKDIAPDILWFVQMQFF